MPSFLADKRVVVTGGEGFLGRAVVRRLDGFDVHVVRHSQYDLIDPDEVSLALFKADVVIHLAAEVGGIGANRENPGRFLYANAMMALNLIEAARAMGIERFVMVGTTCSYPKFCPAPFKEEDLWNGYPEETNAPYGIAKRLAGEMLAAYHTQYGMKSAYVIPTNMYGPGDNFDPASSHVIPAAIRKLVEAVESGSESVEFWGTGQATRDFLYVEDAADGIVRAAECIEGPAPINLGSGKEVSISALVQQIAVMVGYDGEIVWNHEMPDGQPRRLLDCTRADKILGWKATTELADGLLATFDWYRSREVVHEAG